MTAPIRIAFCITDLDAGGAERALVEIVTRLDRQEWEPGVFCLAGPGLLVERLQQADVPVTCLNARGPWNVAVVWRLARELRAFRPRLVQTFLFHANIAGRLAARWAGIPNVISGIRVAEREKRWHIGLDRLTQWLVVHNVCVSEAVAEFSANHAGISKSRISVIPNGVDVSRFENAFPFDWRTIGLPDGSRVLLCVGRLHPQKGPLDLLTAVEPLLAAHSDLHVVFAGDGPLRADLAAWIEARGLQGRIPLLGWRSDVPELLRGAAALVLPSRWEGMPNVVLEAMAAGTPVIATTVEGVTELLSDDESGILCPPHDPASLRAAIARWLATPDSGRELARVSQQIVANRLTIDSVVAGYADLYREVATTVPSAAP